MLIKNGLIATASDVFQADIYIKDGVIQRIGKDMTVADDQVIDATGLFVLPGGIDVHTHFSLDVGDFASSDDFQTGTVAAACGGTTMVVDHIGQGARGETLHDPIHRYHQLAEGKAVIDYSFHGVIPYEVNADRLAEMKQLIAGGIESFKIYMTYGQMLDDADVLPVLQLAKEHNAVVAVHPENNETISYLKEHFRRQGLMSPVYHAKSRPDTCEAEAINRILHLAHSVGDAPIYIVHLSSSLGLEVIQEARKRGQKNIYVETCPQYLLLDESLYDAPSHEGLKYVMSPPLRKKYHQEKLWSGIRSGDIQVVATDHCPFQFETEKLPAGKDDFTKCPNGAPGVEARMPLLFSEGVVKGRISINQFVAVTSTNPAKIYGLYPQKGTIAAGSDADLVLFDPHKKQRISHEMLHENVDYTPYEGMDVTGYPVMTIVRGQVVANDQSFVGAAGFGRFIERYKNNAFFQF